MIIPTTDEMIYIRIIQETNNYNGLSIEQLAEKLEPLRKREYKCWNDDEFNGILEEVIFKLLKYEVLYMVHGRLFLHENIVFVGDSIPDVLRSHLRYLDGSNFFYR